MGIETFGPAKAEKQTADEELYESEGGVSSDEHFLDEPLGDSSNEEVLGETESWNPEMEMLQYNEKNKGVALKLSDIESQLNRLHHEDETDFEDEEIDRLVAEREALQQEKIKASANYPGDWTSLFYYRLTDSVTKEKFISRRTEAMGHMENNPSLVGRREMPRDHYQEQIDNYDTNVERVFSMTEVGPAEMFGSRGRNLGNMGNENVGAVFTDAEHKGVPLTDRQKNIIEAHEKGHCLRDFASPLDRAEIQSVIDRNLITELNALRLANGNERIAPTYVSDPMEIAERMAQFKNYFGMGAKDKFTKQHLVHIREHYVTDTKLDNDVSDLLYVVTPETESAFLDVINKYPI